MNLIEALKQPHPIKRAAWADIHGVDYAICPKYLLQCLGRGDLRPWSQEDLLADDWQVHEPAVRITREGFWQAYATANRTFSKWETEASIHRDSQTRTFKQAVQLGLEKP